MPAAPQGLEKLRDTNEKVIEMEGELSKMQPVLEQNAKDVAELLVQIEHEQKEADQVEQVCKKEEEECLAIMQTCQAIKDDCQADLETALPALRRAEDAVKKLDKDSITEVKSFKQPPEVVVLVMEAVCLLLNSKQSWEAGLKLLASTNFRDSLINYPKVLPLFFFSLFPVLSLLMSLLFLSLSSFSWSLSLSLLSPCLSSSSLLLLFLLLSP